MSFGDGIENSLLDHILGGPNYTRQATHHLALSIGSPGDDGAGLTEPSDPAYAREAITNDASMWPAATESAGIAQKANGQGVQWSTTPALDWGTPTHFALMDAATAGNVIVHGPITTPKQFDVGDPPRYEIGDFVIPFVGGGATLWATTLQQAILDHVFGGPDYTRLADVFIAMSTTDIGLDGSNLTEPSGNGYARHQVPNNATKWPAASAGQKANGQVEDMAPATGSWGTLVDWALMSALSGGSMLIQGPVDLQKPITADDFVRFEVNALKATLD